MPATDLDQRLRRALTAGREPAATHEAMGPIVSALPRYRARRRAVVGAGGASALAVLGLTLALVAVGLGRPPTTTTAEPAGHAPSAEATPAPSCVQVQVGPGSASCAGEIASGPASAPLAAGSQAAQSGRSTNGAGLGATTFSPAAPSPTATITATAGERVVVSLPREARFSWKRITVTDLAAPGGPGRGLTPRVETATGRSVAVLSHVRAGRYAVVATGSGSCATGQPCVPTAYRWSITLKVR